jgi:CDP-diglyceride synthetase
MEKENQQQEVKKSKLKDPNFWKRTISSAIILPTTVLLLLFANDIVMDIFLAALSGICFYEYAKCFKKTKKANPSSWLGYIVCLGVAFTHMLDTEIYKNIVIAIIPIVLFILMVEMLFNEEKKNVMDIFVTLVGILYIPVLISSIVNFSFTSKAKEFKSDSSLNNMPACVAIITGLKFKLLIVYDSKII